MSQKALSRKVNGNRKVILDTHADSDQHQNWTCSRGSLPAPTHQIWWWSMKPFLRYLADQKSAHRQTDWQTDRHTPMTTKLCGLRRAGNKRKMLINIRNINACSQACWPGQGVFYISIWRYSLHGAYTGVGQRVARPAAAAHCSAT